MSFIALGQSSPYWKEAVADVASLPSVGGVTGECRLVLDVDEIYEWNGSSWESVSGGGGGSGDVVGPASATDNAVVRFDTTTGKLIQNSGVTISDTNVVSATGVLVSGLTASRAVQTDASKNLESSAVTSTQLSYVDFTSSGQTQLNAKQGLDATLTALAAYNTNGILTQTAADTFAGRTITGTANEVAVSNGDGVAGNPTLSLPTGIDAAKIADGSVSSTEFQYISTLSSNAQTQLDAKAPLVSPSFTTPSLGAATATQIDITAQGSLRLQDTTGGEYIGVKAAGTTTTYTLTMPAAVPGANQVLADAGAGNGVMAWVAAGGASAATPSAAGTVTSYEPVVRSGTSAQSASYTGTETDGFSTIYFTTSSTNRVYTTPAIAVSEGREITLVKVDTGTGKVSVTLADGSYLGPTNGTTLWSQGAFCKLKCIGGIWYCMTEAISYGSTASTWSWSGGGTNIASVTILYERRGDWISVFLPVLQSASSGTGSTNFANNTGLPAWASPLSGNTLAGYFFITDNGNTLANPGTARIATNGVFTMYKDGTATATYTNTSTCGTTYRQIFSYFVGTGS